MTNDSTGHPWLRRLGLAGAIVIGAILIFDFALSRADGPWFIFSGGPFRSGEPVALEALDWAALDEASEFEMEIVGAGRSLTLWFSVHGGVPYVACDLDCEGGVLPRWPQQVREDDRVVVRIDGRRAEGRLVYVPHDSPEYAAAKVDRSAKYSGDGGGRAAAETAAHGAVVGVGEVLTGRVARDEPGDRLFRIDPR